jgi:hypothetical protein
MEVLCEAPVPNMVKAHANLTLQDSSPAVPPSQPRAKNNTPRSLSWPKYIYRDLGGVFIDTLQRLEDQVLFLDLDGQVEFQAFLTRLLLWTAYESELLHTLSANSLNGSVSSALPTVIRKVLMEPSRLSKMQRQMIDANCLRRARFIIAKKHFTRHQETKAQRLDKARMSEKTNTFELDDAALNFRVNETTKKAWDTNYIRAEFTSTYLNPSRLSTTMLDTRAGSDEIYPKAPEVGKEANGFTCPFCFHHLPAAIVSNSRKWR